MWLFVENDKEYCSRVKPKWDSQDQTYRCLEEMDDGNYWDICIFMPKGSIKKLTGLDTIVESFEYI